jgi:hypothetical protein
LPEARWLLFWPMGITRPSAFRIVRTDCDGRTAGYTNMKRKALKALRFLHVCF